MQLARLGELGEPSRPPVWSGAMIQLGKAKSVPRAEIARVRDACEALLPDDYKDVMVMVTQIECKEPGCPPCETVISLLIVGAPRKAKVYKPVAEVSVEDLRGILPELVPPTGPSPTTAAGDEEPSGALQPGASG